MTERPERAPACGHNQGSREWLWLYTLHPRALPQRVGLVTPRYTPSIRLSVTLPDVTIGLF